MTIHYLVTCYRMPLVIDTNLDGKRHERPMCPPPGGWDYDARSRALTGWLVNPEGISRRVRACDRQAGSARGSWRPDKISSFRGCAQLLPHAARPRGC
jgi:hypothetical protein